MERRNIRLALVFTVIAATASGIYGYSTMSGYLYTLTGKNLYVGLAEGIQGMVQCFAAIPAGIAADRYKNGRSFVLKVSACFGVLATVVTSIGLLIGSPFNEKISKICVRHRWNVLYWNLSRIMGNGNTHNIFRFRSDRQTKSIHDVSIHRQINCSVDWTWISYRVVCDIWRQLGTRYSKICICDWSLRLVSRIALSILFFKMYNRMTQQTVL